MKITINMNKTETNIITRFVNKYDPNADLYKDETRKFGSTKTTTDGDNTTVNVELKTKFIADALSFIEDIADVIISASKHLNFIFDGARDHFSQWIDKYDLWEDAAKQYQESNGDKDYKYAALVQHEKDTVRIYDIKYIEDLVDVNNQNAERRFIRFDNVGFEWVSVGDCFDYLKERMTVKNGQRVRKTKNTGAQNS